MGGKGSGRRRRSSISSFRGLLYGLAKFLGDANAIGKGKVGRRIARRAAGRASGRLMRLLTK